MKAVLNFLVWSISLALRVHSSPDTNEHGKSRQAGKFVKIWKLVLCFKLNVEKGLILTDIRFAAVNLPNEHDLYSKSFLCVGVLFKFLP